MADKRKRMRRGIGLYEWPEVRSESAVTFTGAVLVGAAIVLVGVAIAVRTLDLIRAERAAFGEADPHWLPWLAAAGSIVIGVFVAHAGVIHWFRRITGRD